MYNYRRLFIFLFYASVVFFLIILILAANVDGSRKTITGIAEAWSGDTLSLEGQKIRLKDISACKPGQTAVAAGVTFDCGQWAKDKLQSLINNHRLHCKQYYRSKNDAIIGQCFKTLNKGLSISQEMLQIGGAFQRNWLQTNNGKSPATVLNAQKHKLGIWSFKEIEHPEMWERKQRESKGISSTSKATD